MIFIFHFLYGIILPTDEFSYISEGFWYTTNQANNEYFYMNKEVS